uniref:Ribosomal protein S11 n=1 Tax=Trachydiscus minutus TaxID=1032745 RepID=A0A140F2N4_9STRA|nr:ribosomal protein S11 [Trachydiscus minutus]AML60668.1 ribosomal protein S11 [Trachydiscus minutus]
MFKLKEFYQYKRELVKRNKILRLSLNKFSLNKLHKLGLCDARDYGQGILYLKVSQNNTIISLTNLKGKVEITKSCGCLGFQGKKKRSTKFAIESTLFSVIKKVKELQWKRIAVYLNGFAKGRFYILNSLKKNNLKLGLVRDVTAIPHNGCRPKKLRRG